MRRRCPHAGHRILEPDPPIMPDRDYAGSELDLFADAVQWKRYWSGRVRPFLGARVLDVGAGIGATARVFRTGSFDRWLALEPDPALCVRIDALRIEGELPPRCEVRTGTTADLGAADIFDTALYIDVLEHIEDDAGELSRVAGHIAVGGHIVVLAPAHRFLYSAFDRRIGHFRRYDRAGLEALSPDGWVPVHRVYLDSAGMLASLANRLLMRQSMPTKGQIRFWDRILVRCSLLLDALLRGKLGKSILFVYRRIR